MKPCLIIVETSLDFLYGLWFSVAIVDAQFEQRERERERIQEKQEAFKKRRTLTLCLD